MQPWKPRIEINHIYWGRKSWNWKPINIIVVRVNMTRFSGAKICKGGVGRGYRGVEARGVERGVKGRWKYLADLVGMPCHMTLLLNNRQPAPTRSLEWKCQAWHSRQVLLYLSQNNGRYEHLKQEETGVSRGTWVDPLSRVGDIIWLPSKSERGDHGSRSPW